MNESKPNPVVGICASIGGIAVAIVAVLAIFAPSHLCVAPWIVGVLALMGIILGFLASKK